MLSCQRSGETTVVTLRISKRGRLREVFFGGAEGKGDKGEKEERVAKKKGGGTEEEWRRGSSAAAEQSAGRGSKGGERQCISLGAFWAEAGTNNEFIWKSWIDPLDDRVDFHRLECFGTLVLSDE